MRIYEVLTKCLSFWHSNKRKASKCRAELKRSKVPSDVIRHDVGRNKREIIALLNRNSQTHKEI